MNMQKERTESNVGILKSVIIAIIVFFVLMYFMTGAFTTDTGGFREVAGLLTADIKYADGHSAYYDIGESYTVNKGDHFEFHFTAGEENRVENGVLVFFLYNCLVDVYCDDELIYSQDRNVEKGQMLGDRKYAIMLPEGYETKEIKIVGDLISNSPFSNPASIKIVPFDKVNLAPLANNEMIFYTFYTMIFVSIMMGIFFIVLSFQDKKVQPGIWVSLETLLLCCWYLGYKTQFYVVSDWVEFNATIEYLAIIAFSVPLSFYMRSQFSHELFRRISLVLGILSLIFFVVSTYLNYSSATILYCDVLVYSHILSGIGLLFFLVALFLDDSKDKNFDYKILKYGILAAMVIGVIYLISFNISGRVQSILKLDQINFVPLAIMVTIFAMYINVVTSYAQETISTMEAKRLSRLAYIDSLTGLPNRYALYESFQEMYENGIIDYVMVFMDINDLKVTNDRYGHKSGDELINDVAEAMTASFPNDHEKGVIGRWGGDEFIACVYGDEAEADKYIEAFKEKMAATGHTVSVGKAISTAKEPKDPSIAVSESDSAMYVDKALFKKGQKKKKNLAR